MWSLPPFPNQLRTPSLLPVPRATPAGLSFRPQATGGRNELGRLTVRGRGGGDKKIVRTLDFLRADAGVWLGSLRASCFLLPISHVVMCPHALLACHMAMAWLAATC